MQCTKHGPWASGLRRSIAAVDGPAHATHHRGDLLAFLELASGCSGDDAGRLDAEHARKGDALREAQPRVQLGAIDPKRLDPERECGSELLDP
jgi:hypothetical protein